LSKPLCDDYNAANISTTQLLKIFQYAADIFIKNGFNGISFWQIPASKVKELKTMYQDQAFLAIIDQEFYEYDKVKHLKKNLGPGNSQIRVCLKNRIVKKEFVFFVNEKVRIA